MKNRALIPLTKIFLTLIYCAALFTSHGQKISVEREALKEVMVKAEMATVYEAEIQNLSLDNNRLKAALTKAEADAQAYKNEVEATAAVLDKVRMLLLVLCLAIVAYVIVKIRSRN